MNTFRRALVLSFVERYLLIALGLAGSMILARLLKPEEIGIFSVSVAVFSVALIVRDIGIGTYIIQKSEISEELLQTAFGLSLALGLLLFLILVSAAPAIGGFYGDVRMVDTLQLAALNFIALPFWTLPVALLRRSMRFKALLYINVAAGIAGFVASIGTAIGGAGPESMVYGMLAVNVTTSIGAGVVVGRAGFPQPSLAGWRSFLHFGGRSTVMSAITSISMDANDLIVGKALGFQPVAILSRAQGLINFYHRDVMTAVRNVAFPAFAEAHRRQEPIGRLFSRSVEHLAATAWPFYAVLAIYSVEAVRLLYGPQWNAAAEIVPVFCVAGAVSVWNALVPNLLIATGRIDLAFRAELITQLLRIGLVALAALIVGTIWACATAFALASVAAFPVFLHYRNRALGDRVDSVRPRSSPSTLVTLATMAPALIHVAVSGSLARSEPISMAEVVPVLLACTACWVAAIKLCNHPVSQELAFHAPYGWVRRLFGAGSDSSRERR